MLPGCDATPCSLCIRRNSPSTADKVARHTQDATQYLNENGDRRPMVVLPAVGGRRDQEAAVLDTPGPGRSAARFTSRGITPKPHTRSQPTAARAGPVRATRHREDLAGSGAGAHRALAFRTQRHRDRHAVQAAADGEVAHLLLQRLGQLSGASLFRPICAAFVAFWARCARTVLHTVAFFFLFLEALKNCPIWC